MKILDITSLKCKNRWSSYWEKLIVMKLDIGELEDYPTNKIPGFAERMEKLLPSLYEHECSEGKPGGFYERVRLGTWMGHVVEHLALEIQSLAGMDCGFGRTRSAGSKGVYNVVFVYEVEKAGFYAAAAAIEIAQALINDVEYDIEVPINELRKIYENEMINKQQQTM
jgi:cyanophycin synthetase